MYGLGMDFGFILGVIGKHCFEEGLWLLCGKQTTEIKEWRAKDYCGNSGEG